MNTEKMELLLENQWTAMEFNGKFWHHGDVTVTILDGTVFIRAEESPVWGLRLRGEETALSNALVLGDTWERGYGDLGWLPPDRNRVLPWYFLAFDGEKTYGWGVKTQPGALCFWRYDGKTPELTMDLRSGTEPVLLAGRELAVCTLVSRVLEGDIHAACAGFCRMLCDAPRQVERPIFGGNDWYCCYGDNSYEKIRLLARRVARCAQGLPWQPYMVVDDGWQLCHRNVEGPEGWYDGGPWHSGNRRFGDMGDMARAIREEGAIPGIWIRPLQTLEKLPTEYYLRINGNDMPLDPSHPGVLEMVQADIRTIVSWGYRLIKHDFSSFDTFGQWGFEMGSEPFRQRVRFHDNSKTTAEILRNFYLAIRQAAGEEVLIMGCNTFSHISAGIMDIQRTGDDTSGREWARTKKYGINTLAFRMMQHGAFYCVDADCVGITRAIPWEINRRWLDVLAKSGTPLFVSVAEDAFSEEVQRDLEIAFRQACEAKGVSRPVDWLHTLTPEVWESSFGTDHYTW